MSGEITGEFNLSEDVQQRMSNEITRQITPMVQLAESTQTRLVAMGKAVEEIKKQNAEQIATLAAQNVKMQQFDYWRSSLFGNGSGIPGFLELARKEDKDRIEKLFQVVSELKQDKYKEEGKKELLQDQEAKRISELSAEDSHKTHLWTRYHYMALIAGSFGGTWILHLILPLLKAVIDHLIKGIQ